VKMIRIGCGCILLVTQEGTTLAKSTVRLLDYCGGGSDEPSLRIGREQLMSMHATEFNLAPDKVTEVSAAECTALFDQVGALVGEGYRFRELQRILKSTVAVQ
jgi:hypothetical protein